MPGWNGDCALLALRDDVPWPWPWPGMVYTHAARMLMCLLGEYDTAKPILDNGEYMALIVAPLRVFHLVHRSRVGVLDGAKMARAQQSTPRALLMV
jgi:hypothetical protein